MQRVLHHPARLKRAFAISLALSLVLHFLLVVYLEHFFYFTSFTSKHRVQAERRFTFKQPDPEQVLTIAFEQKEHASKKAKAFLPQAENWKNPLSSVALKEGLGKMDFQLEKMNSSHFTLKEENLELPKSLLIKEDEAARYHFTTQSFDRPLLAELKSKYRLEPFQTETALAGFKLDAFSNKAEEGKPFFVKPVLISSLSSFKKGEGVLFLDEPQQENQLLAILKKMRIEGSFVALIEGAKNTFDPLVPYIPTLKDLKTISFGYNFDMEVEYIAKEKNGFVFAVTLIPKETLELDHLRQNFYFV
ncbi:MAG: hypothetical protein WC371_04230, partial [Parachlamydiales bacterium]